MSLGPLPSSSSTTRKRPAVGVGDDADADDDNPLLQPGGCRSLDGEASEVGSSVDDMALRVPYNNLIDLTGEDIRRVYYSVVRQEHELYWSADGVSSAAAACVVDENSASLLGSAISMMATVEQVDANEQQQQPSENEQDANNRSGNIDAVTAAVPTVTGVSTGASAKSSNNAGNDVDCNSDVDEVAFDYDDDDKSSDFDDESRRLPKHRFVTFASNFRSKLEGMPAEAIQRALPEMYRDYLRCSATRDWYSWSNKFHIEFTECFRLTSFSEYGRRERCPRLQFDWVNETVAFQESLDNNLHLKLGDKSVRLIHYMAVEDIKRFARICWRSPRLTSILIRHDFKYDKKMNHFFLEAGASSAHSRLEQLTLVCCGCRMPTWVGSMITLVQSSTTLTTIELMMHKSPHQVTSKPPSCVDSNRIVLEGVLQCKSLQVLILFPPVHRDDPAFMLMVEATLIWHRNMQGQGLFKLQYKGPSDHGCAPLCPATAFFLMRGALLGSVERLEISCLVLDGSTIAQFAEAAQGTPLESKLALKHLRIMDIQLGRTIDGAETSKSISRLLSNLPCLEYVAIDRHCLIPQSMPQAPVPFVCFCMDSQEFTRENLYRFFELLPSFPIRALCVDAFFHFPDILERHPSAFHGLHELHIYEYTNRERSVSDRELISRLWDVLDHNTNLLKFSLDPYADLGRVRIDSVLNLLCRRNICIRMLRSYRNKSADCLVPAALAYLGQFPRNVQFAFSSLSSSSSSSVALTTSTANVSASAIFTYLQKQQLEICVSTNLSE